MNKKLLENQKKTLQLDSIKIFFQNPVIIDFLVSGIQIVENDQLSNNVYDGLQKYIKNNFIQKKNQWQTQILLDVQWDDKNKSITINSQQYTIKDHFQLKLNQINSQLTIDQLIRDANDNDFILRFKIKDLLSYFKIQNQVDIKYHNELFQVNNLLPLYPIDGCDDIIFNFMQEIFNIISNPQQLFTKDYPNKKSFLDKIFKSLLTINEKSNCDIYQQYNGQQNTGITFLQKSKQQNFEFNLDIYQQYFQKYFHEVYLNLYLDNILVFAYDELTLNIYSCFIQIILQILGINLDEDQTYNYPAQKKYFQLRKK